MTRAVIAVLALALGACAGWQLERLPIAVGIDREAAAAEARRIAEAKLTEDNLPNWLERCRTWGPLIRVIETDLEEIGDRALLVCDFIEAQAAVPPEDRVLSPVPVPRPPGS